MFKIGVVTAPDGANIRQRQQAVPEKKAAQKEGLGFGKYFAEACEKIRKENSNEQV